MILSVFLWLPLIAAILIIAVPGGPRYSRSMAVAAGIGMMVLAGYITVEGSQQLSSLAHGSFLFLEDRPWLVDLGISYKLGVDGLSLPMVLLSGLISFSSLMLSHNIKTRQREFYALALVAICGVVGTFLALDLFFFILFFLEILM